MRLTQQQLEAHLWGAANILRGKTAGQDYKNYILSLMFFKRLCDQWEHEADEAIAEQERQQSKAFTEKQKAIFRARGEHRFKIPDGSRWGDILAVSENIGEKLTAAMRAVSSANDELRGVFTVDWAQPAPDGSGKKLIPNEVVHALIQHFNEIDLSNKSVPPDVLGRAYEYLIKQFADDAGAKAGEFFTPPEVVDILVRILQPKPGDTIYDPTCGSGGMLIHSADYLREHGHNALAARYFGHEMNWSNFAIGKINSVLHGLEADIKGGASTITDPQHLDHGKLKKFSLCLANFPFSDEFWWLKPEQQTDDKKKRDKLKKEVFGKEGYKDNYGRFGRGTGFASPPAGYGDYAFILHILASLTDEGRAGVVCPQGVLFRGQPEVEEETGEFDDEGNPKFKRRKADDEHLVRQALLDSRLIDAVISLPLNVFYGAGVPACLLILRKERPPKRHDKVLLVYAARHYRELSNQNELRPQDVLRILVHYHAYGDPKKVPALVAEHSGRMREQINQREAGEVERLEAEYKPHADKLAKLKTEIAELQAETKKAGKKTDKAKIETKITKLEAQKEKLTAKTRERDARITEARRRAEEDRKAVTEVGHELGALYGNPDELLKHARVVPIDEVQDNDFNLNIPRYVDTFKPEPRIEVKDASKPSKKRTRNSRNRKNVLPRCSGRLAMQNECFPDAPPEWDKGPISMIADINPRYPIKKGQELSFIEMAAVAEQFGGIQRMDTRKLEGSGLAKFKAGDTLFAKITPCPENGKVAFVHELPSPFGIGSTEFIVLSPKENCDPRYLYHLVCAHAVRGRAASRMEGSTGRQRVPDDVFAKRLLVPIPTKPEQERIVSFLDTVDGTIRDVANAESAARRLATSLITTEIERQNAPAHRLKEYITDIRYGTSQASNERNWGYPTLRIPNVIGDQLSLTDVTYVDVRQADRERLALQDGDLLLVRTNGNPHYVGRSAVFRSPDNGTWLYASYLIRVRMNGGVRPEYLNVFLGTERGRRELLRRVTTSAGNHNINSNSVRLLSIPVPASRKDQERVVEIANAARERFSVLATKKTKLLRLKTAIMAELLSGQNRLTAEQWKLAGAL